MEKLLNEVLNEITPTKEEGKKDLKVVKEVTTLLKQYKVNPILVGSIEKGTDLHGNKDIDIFIQFKQNVPREEMERKALEIGKSVFKKLKGTYEIDYAEHPYVKGKYGSYVIEIVPCYTGKTIMSSVDRTPFHTKYVKKKIRGNPKLGGEIRLLKKFMKAQNVYGAEAKTEGFSGYLTELLAIKYGSFLEVLKAATKWSMPEVIDAECLWDDPASLKHYFTQASLIVIDPVDKNRNVAAAVCKEKLAEFVVAADKFLKSPAKEFFFPKEIKVKSMKELKEAITSRETKLIAVVLKHKKLNENTLYGQLKKTLNSLKEDIERKEFKVFKASYWTNEKDTSILLYEMEVWDLPEIKQHKGPPIDVDPINQEKFTEKYKKDKPYIKDGRWVVETKRQDTDATKLIKNLTNKRDGYGKNLRQAEKTTILEGKETLKINEQDWLRHLTKNTTK
ncbi:MAG: CCA tRNA nucleotidyltransferase [Candidatus Altiarchaeota archaeon]|nr:CCA tRNA nucleotidyltransferase [Candidatus Altiarchaeota archaeon]